MKKETKTENKPYYYEIVVVDPKQKPNAEFPSIMRYECKKHPKYKAVVKPKINCAGCWFCFIQRKLTKLGRNIFPASDIWPSLKQMPMEGEVSVKFLK